MQNNNYNSIIGMETAKNQPIVESESMKQTKIPRLNCIDHGSYDSFVS